MDVRRFFRFYPEHNIPQIMLAVEDNDIEAVSRFIDDGVDINRIHSAEFDDFGQISTSCILVAIRRGYVDMARLLIDAGVNLRAIDDDKSNPLFHAMLIEDRERRWEMVELLMNAGVSVLHESADSNGVSDSSAYTSYNVHAAVEANDFELVKFFLNAGAELNCLRGGSPLHGMSPLHAALSVNHFQYIPYESRVRMVEQLLAIGADVNLCGSMSRTTCLHYLYSDCTTTLLKLLLDAGAQLNVVNRRFISPLAQAIMNNVSHAVIKEMIEAGASVDIEKRCSYSALSKAVTSRRKDIVELLLESGADYKAVDQDGRNILYCAAESFDISKALESIAIIQLLLDWGVSVNCPEYEEPFLPFGSILAKGNMESMKLFFKYGIELKNCGVRYPLHRAAANTRKEILEYLLETHLYDVNQLDDTGKTALLIAIDRNNLPCARLLIEYGADVDCVFDQQTLLDRTHMYDNTSPDLLFAAGANRITYPWIIGNTMMRHSDYLPEEKRIRSFVGQIVLLKSQKLRYSKVSNSGFESLMNAPPRSRVNQTLSELEALKTVVLYESITLLDSLVGKDISRFINNTHVKKIFESPNFIDRYPIYGNRLQEFYSLSCARRKVMDQAKPVLDSILEFHFNGCNEIFHKIMSHLHMHDLRNLCRA